MEDTTTTAIAVRGLCKDYAGVEILRDISFDVPKGTTTCLLGPSGSGKSTLLRCINWLEVPSRGTIHVAGSPMGRCGDGLAAKPLTRKQLATARGRIGTVFQHFALWPHMTVLGNVMEAPVNVHGRPRAEVKDEAMALLESVGLGSKADAYPHQISGGQKQRAAIARALAIRPEVLLFDEPTSALDPEMVGEVLNAMRALAERGMTMLIVTHEMAFARDVADNILFLDGGKVVEAAAPALFFGAPRTDRARRFLSRFSG